MKCGFEVKGGSSKDEALQIVADHAGVAHWMQTIPPNVASKLSAVIH